MGGMMGAMLGVMVRLSPLAIWGTAALMTLLLLLSLAGLYHLVQSRCARPAAIDPVCGMAVDPATAPASTVYREQRLYFCAPACRRAFEKEPERYRRLAGPRATDASPASRQVVGGGGP
jgi:YHS domain-containing protein